MESPVTIQVPRMPLTAVVRLFIHSRRCEECNVRFWAFVAMAQSGLSMIHAVRGQRARAWVRLQVAKFATRRRILAMREIGIKPFEDMSAEEKRAAIAEMQGAGIEVPDNILKAVVGERPRLH